MSLAKLIVSTLTSISILLFAMNSHALYSVMENAELVEKGKYLVTGETQFATSGDSGLNLIGRFDGRLTDATGYRAELGFGSTDFSVAGFFKWAPIPDLNNQPAIALSSGVVYARDNDINNLTLRLAPIVSKRFQIELGDLTPYGSLPINFSSLSGTAADKNASTTIVPVQLVVGTQLMNPEWGKFKLSAEIGLNVSKAFSYFSLGFSVPLDPDSGFEFR